MANKSIPQKPSKFTLFARRNIGFTFIAIWLVGFLVFRLYPFISSLVYSFSDFHLFNGISEWGLMNYEQIFTDKKILKSLGVTFRYSFTTVPLKLAMVSCALFQFMWSSNDFMGPLLYVKTVEKYPATIFVKLSMDADTGFDWNRVLAVSFISIIPQLIVFFCAQNQFIDGISAGSVKG